MRGIREGGEDKIRSKCANCQFVFMAEAEDLSRIHRLTERVFPGGMVPSAECPKCFALAYPMASARRRRGVR